MGEPIPLYISFYNFACPFAPMSKGQFKVTHTSRYVASS